MPEKSAYLITLRPKRAGFTPDTATEFESGRILAHWEFLQAEHGLGNIIFVGRTASEPFVGLCVFEAASELEAETFMSRDPAIEAGVFTGTVQPFSVALIRS